MKYIRKNQQNIFNLLCFLALSVLGGAFFANEASASNKMLMLHPLRIVFTERERAITANIINQSNDTIKYSVSLVTMRKGSDGRLFEPEKETAEELLVKNMIRFSPRRATIGPKQRQVIKMMVRKPKDLIAGEYRTFIRLTPHPSASVISSPTNEKLNEQFTEIELLVSSTMPIVIQHDIPVGKIEPVSIKVKEEVVSRNEIPVELILSRQGKGSSFGNIFIEYFPLSNPEKSIEVGRVQGLAVYFPETEKKITVTLKGINLQELKSGKIRVNYYSETGVVQRRKVKENRKVYKDFSM